jgi:hypothetical protein
MKLRSLLVLAVGAVGLLSLQAQAQTHSPGTAMLDLQSVTIGERGTELLLRFNRPINHTQSWLTLERGGKTVGAIHFRLESEPNVLFARIQTPAPGNYTVHWNVCPDGSDDRYQGDFPISVGPTAASGNPADRAQNSQPR